MERWRTHQAFSLRNSRTLPRSHNPTVGTTLAPFSFRGRSHTWYFLFLFLFFSLVYRLARFSIPRASEMGTHALSVVLHFRLFTCHALWKSVMRRRRDESWQRPQHGIGGRIFIIAIKKIIVENQGSSNLEIGSPKSIKVGKKKWDMQIFNLD